MSALLEALPRDLASTVPKSLRLEDFDPEAQSLRLETGIELDRTQGLEAIKHRL